MTEQTQTQTPAVPETPAQPEQNSKQDGDAAGGESPKGGDKLFSQAELDAIVKDRLDRAKAKADTDAAKAREKAAADALAEQGEFKKLSENQAKQLLDLTAEKDVLVAERDALQEKAGKYETALTKLLDTYKASIPEHVKPLLDRLDPVEQLDWIAANQETFKAQSGFQPIPRTPAADGRGLSAAQQEAAKKQVDRTYRQRF